MKLFSKASEYAILAIMRAIETDSLDGFSTSDVCQGAGIPEPVGRKVLVDLAKGGLITGKRGPGGGYKLARKAENITLMDIVIAVDGPAAFEICPLGFRCERGLKDCRAANRGACPTACPECGLGHICPLHGLWGDMRGMVTQRLESMSLEVMRRRLVDTGELMV